MIRKLLISLVLTLPNGAPRAAAGELPGGNVKAADLYNFTQYVEWPTQALALGHSPLVIVVLGKDPFGKSLEEAVQGKTAGGHPVQVKRLGAFSDGMGPQLAKCQVLFIASSEKDRLAEILDALKGASTLTVSNIGQFCEMGGEIQLGQEGPRSVLTLNLVAVKKAKLSMRSQLLSIAQFYWPQK